MTCSANRGSWLSLKVLSRRGLTSALPDLPHFPLGHAGVAGRQPRAPLGWVRLFFVGGPRGAASGMARAT